MNLPRNYNADDGYNQNAEEKENLTSIQMLLVFCLFQIFFFSRKLGIFEHSHFQSFYSLIVRHLSSPLILMKVKNAFSSAECMIIWYVKSIKE